MSEARYYREAFQAGASVTFRTLPAWSSVVVRGRNAGGQSVLPLRVTAQPDSITIDANAGGEIYEIYFSTGTLTQTDLTGRLRPWGQAKTYSPEIRVAAQVATEDPPPPPPDSVNPPAWSVVYGI